MSLTDTMRFTPDNRVQVSLAEGDVCIAASYSEGEVDIRRNSGTGRVLVYDKDLKVKGALWTDEEGLVVGLEYNPQSRCLFVTDLNAQTVKRFSRDGVMMPSFPDMQGKSFGVLASADDGSIYTGEHIKGDKFPFIGGGEIYHFDGQGAMLEHFAADRDPGKFGFHGVTSMVLAPGGKTALYISETGKRVMQYDLVGDRQMDDLFALPEEADKFTAGIALTSAGEILISSVYGVDLYSREGELLKEYDIPRERGWSALRLSADGQAFFVGNFFTGRLEKRSLESGDILAATESGLVYRLGTIAEIS